MILFALFALAGAAMASFRVAPAPDTVILVYSSGDVPLGSNVTLGTDGYGWSVDNSPYADAMTWQTSVMLTYPNGARMNHSIVYAGLLRCPLALRPVRAALSQWVVDTESIEQTGM